MNKMNISYAASKKIQIDMIFLCFDVLPRSVPCRFLAKKKQIFEWA